MPTLTNEQVQTAYRKIQMIGQEDLPIKVSYALTRTKNKYLKPEAESFLEETEAYDEGSEEMQTHLNYEVEVNAHNVSVRHLKGAGVRPELFSGLTFIFSESEQAESESRELEIKDIVSGLNVLSEIGQTPCSSPDVIFQIARAVEFLRSGSQEISTRLEEFNQRLQDLDDDFEGSPGEEVSEERRKIISERRDFLTETRVIEVSTIELDALLEEEDLSVAPAELEAIDEFLEA